ncbi:MAG: EAL domain-containing protein [Gemmatimonadetes bacterium]|nr:EAL domain-containing protein [Gemmatimonadota bacterium]
MSQRIAVTALRIALVYALLGALWVSVSDLILSRLVSADWLQVIHAYSDWVLVAGAAVALFLLVDRELRARQRAEDVVRQSEARFRALVQHSADVIFVLSEEGMIRFASPNLETVLGRTVPPGESLNILEVVNPPDRENAARALDDLRREPNAVAATEFRAMHVDGSLRTLEVWGKNLLLDPTVEGILLNARDVTERKQYEAEIQRLAYFDPLTGLANRRLLRERAKQALALAKRRANIAALLYLDLDRFKAVNDTLGHDAGDELLQQVAQRLTKCIRDSDTLSRLGGDEFAILLTEVRAEEDAAVVARRVVQALQESIWVQQQAVHIGTSIGIAIYPRDGTTFEEVIKHADIAMYRAKQEKAGYQFYRPELSVYTRERLVLEEELRRALEQNELVLHYQPVLAVTDRTVAGAEALSRWLHRQRGEISAGEFIGIAEETGLIVPLDRWAVSSAVRLGRASLQGGWGGWVAVNLSARSFADPDLVSHVARSLELEGLEPTRLVLEITESAAMRNPDATADLLHKLKDVGVLVALDDFGMGYSSLAYLKRFPVDILKLDKNFTRGIGSDAKDERLIEAVITLAHSLGVQVLAEGVEQQTQLNWLVSEGCDLVQGYLIGKPRPSAEFEIVQRVPFDADGSAAMAYRPFPEY